MKKICTFFLLAASALYAAEPSPAERIYTELRRLHTGGLAAKAFTAKLTEPSARRLLKDKIPGKDWHVAVEYSLYTGLSLKIRGSDAFYENALSQYEQHINEMLLPLLSTRGYERFKQNFVFFQGKNGAIGVAFKKGDIAAEYLFQIGDSGLIRRLDYYEDKSRKYAVAVQWKDIGGSFVPSSVKAVSYEGARAAGDFDLEEIKITEK